MKLWLLIVVLKLVHSDPQNVTNIKITNRIWSKEIGDVSSSWDPSPNSKDWYLSFDLPSNSQVQHTSHLSDSLLVKLWATPENDSPGAFKIKVEIQNKKSQKTETHSSPRQGARVHGYLKSINKVAEGKPNVTQQHGSWQKPNYERWKEWRTRKDNIGSADTIILPKALVENKIKNLTSQNKTVNEKSGKTGSSLPVIAPKKVGNSTVALPNKPRTHGIQGVKIKTLTKETISRKATPPLSVLSTHPKIWYLLFELPANSLVQHTSYLSDSHIVKLWGIPNKSSPGAFKIKLQIQKTNSKKTATTISPIKTVRDKMRAWRTYPRNGNRGKLSIANAAIIPKNGRLKKKQNKKKGKKKIRENKHLYALNNFLQLLSKPFEQNTAKKKLVKRIEITKTDDDLLIPLIFAIQDENAMYGQLEPKTKISNIKLQKQSHKTNITKIEKLKKDPARKVLSARFNYIKPRLGTKKKKKQIRKDQITRINNTRRSSRKRTKAIKEKKIFESSETFEKREKENSRRGKNREKKTISTNKKEESISVKNKPKGKGRGQSNVKTETKVESQTKIESDKEMQESKNFHSTKEKRTHRSKQSGGDKSDAPKKKQKPKRHKKKKGKRKAKPKNKDTEEANKS